MSERIFQCEVHARKYKGSLATLTPTGKFYYRPPFKVRESELHHYLGKDGVSDLLMECDLLASTHHDSRGDRWTRIA